MKNAGSLQLKWLFCSDKFTQASIDNPIPDSNIDFLSLNMMKCQRTKNSYVDAQLKSILLFY